MTVLDWFGRPKPAADTLFRWFREWTGGQMFRAVLLDPAA